MLIYYHLPLLVSFPEFVDVACDSVHSWSDLATLVGLVGEYGEGYLCRFFVSDD
jgi:hypothetical protein